MSTAIEMKNRRLVRIVSLALVLSCSANLFQFASLMFPSKSEFSIPDPLSLADENSWRASNKIRQIEPDWILLGENARLQSWAIGASHRTAKEILRDFNGEILAETDHFYGPGHWNLLENKGTMDEQILITWGTELNFSTSEWILKLKSYLMKQFLKV